MLTWQRIKLAFEELGQKTLSHILSVLHLHIAFLVQEAFAPLFLFWRMWNKHSTENSSQTVEILLMVFIFPSFHIHTQRVLQDELRSLRLTTFFNLGLQSYISWHSSSKKNLKICSAGEDTYHH